MSETITIAVYEIDFFADKPSVTIEADSEVLDHANDRLTFFLRGEKVKSFKYEEISGWGASLKQVPQVTP